MSPVVWLAADTLSWPQGGGYLWTALNWALGLRAAGCEVVWLESAEPHLEPDELRSLVNSLEQRLERYGLDSVALCSRAPEPLPRETTEGRIEIDAVGEADLLLNMSYDAPQQILGRCRRTAMLDVDPGLAQIWISEGVQILPTHDLYFTIGETVVRPDGTLPDAGVRWLYTPPCVALEWWPVVEAAEGSPFTTVSNWETRGDWVTYGNESYLNSKREGFLPFLDLPRHTSQPLELALCLAADEELRLDPYQEEERRALEVRGWRVVHSYTVASTPWDYQRYIQGSRGEFSCAKPSGARLQNAWISDRTLCYLASGKPAVVEHTGPSRFLPDAEGLFRFHDVQQAASYLDAVADDYDRQARLARRLADELFDAKKVAGRLLDLALR
jgi:hypothetical protein